MKGNNYILLLFFMLLVVPVTAQTVESFRIIKGIPHLPVLESTASVSSPVPGMMIFSHADKTVMVYSGGAWDNFTTTTNVASSSNSKKYFQIINGIPVLPVMSTLTGAVRPGAMYYPSSGGGVRLNNGQEWKGPRDYVRGAEESDFNQVIAGRVNNVDGMIVFPVLSSAPKDVEAGAVYITNRFPRMKVFDGTNWLELAVDSYPNTPIPPVKIGNTTWAPVNAGYDNTRPHGFMYQWHRKYGQEYESANTYNGPVPLLIGKTLAVAVRFYYSASSPYDWCSTQQASWNMEDYNPCPTGWRVPTQEELTELNQAGSTWVAAGGPDDLPGRWYGGNHSTDRVGSVFFPASGQRSYDVGAVSGRSSNGYYWSSVTSGTNAVSLNLRDAYSNITTGSYRASGYSVRCVKESYAATITGATSFCEGGSVTLTASPGVSYSWDTGATTQSITASGPGTYTVTVTFPDGSSQEASILVRTLQWSDAGTLSGDQTICVGETTQFTASKSGGTWSSMNPSIALVDSYGKVTGVKAGTTSIEYVWGSPCPGYVYRDVTVYDLPVLGGVDNACAGTTANVTPATGGTWTSSNTSVATVTNGGAVTAKVAGTTTLTFTNTTTGCSNTVTFTVNPKPNPVVTADCYSAQPGHVGTPYLNLSFSNLPEGGKLQILSPASVADASASSYSGTTDSRTLWGIIGGTYSYRITTAEGCTYDFSGQICCTEMPTPVVEVTCRDPKDAYPYHSIVISNLLVTGGVIIDKDKGEKYPFTPHSTVRIDIPVYESTREFHFEMTDENGCSLDFEFKLCCPEPFTPAVKIFCVPVHEEGGMLVAPHAQVHIDGLPDGGTIAEIKPSTEPEKEFSGTSYLLTPLSDGTYTYLIKDKNGCSKYISFTVECDDLHFDWEKERDGECGKDITSDIRIINLPADYWRIMPGEIVGGKENGGVYSIQKLNPGDYIYSVYNDKSELLGTLPVAIPYPSNGQQTTVILKNEDYNNKVGDLYFPEISAKNWRIKVGTYKEVEGSGTTYTVSKVPAGTYDVTVIDMDTQCQSEIKSVTICK